MIEPKERAITLEQLINKKSEGGFTLNYNEVWRDGRIRPAYVLCAEGRNCSPTAYCDDAWFEMDDEAVADYLLHLYEEHALQLDVNALLNREYVEANVLPRVVPDSNMDALKKSGIVCRPYLNLAVIYYLPIEAMGKGATVQVSESLLRNVGLTAEDVDWFAMRNLKSTVDIVSMDAMLTGMLQDTGEDFEMPPTPDVGMWIITNHSRCFGAAALLYGEKLFEALQEKFGLRRDGDGRRIAILPSSVHELICVFYERDEQLKDFLSMVKEVNATQVAEEDLLGDCVYYHNGNTVCAFA